MPAPIHSGLIYDVSVSIDGYISGPDNDISQFPKSEKMVDDYLRRRDGYQTSLMGRATYEFGYAFGMVPGDNPYPHMRTIVLSKTLALPDDATVERVDTDAVHFVRNLKTQSETPLYLCGGGALAGSLAREGLIDVLVLKRVPIIVGGGTRLFGDAGAPLSVTQTDQVDYGDGMFLQTFRCGVLRA